MTDRQILETVLTEVRGLGSRMDGFESQMDKFESQMDRMEERQKRFEEETRNNFADIRLHLENMGLNGKTALMKEEPMEPAPPMTHTLLFLISA